MIRRPFEGAADTARDEEGLRRALATVADGCAWIAALDEDQLDSIAERRSAIERCLSSVRDALGLVRTHADVVTAEPQTDEFAWDDGPAPAESPVARVPDTVAIAFVAGFALRGRESALLAADVRDRWQVLAAVDGAAREIERTASAVDAAVTGEPTLRSSSLGEAIRIRRAYVRFGAAVAAGEPPGSDELASRLRLAGTAIVKLVGDESHSRIRAGDRRAIRALHDRILAWLRAGGDDRVAGARLWQELASLSVLLMGINRRPELVMHDGAAIARALAAIEQSRPEDVAREAASLMGRDAELDALVQQGAPAAAIRAALLRVADALTDGERAREIDDGTAPRRRDP
ncbi:MAG: hypothetical protein K1X88_23555 [Nannocystaceae bacterium]|nr:hypothetical protein [Nannocystaceae bacterium]